MNVSEYMEKHGLTDAALEEMVLPYEQGEYESEAGTVHSSSHVDAVGKRRVTVIYDASATQRVTDIARRRGVKPSEIYRDALTTTLLRRRSLPENTPSHTGRCGSYVYF